MRDRNYLDFVVEHSIQDEERKALEKRPAQVAGIPADLHQRKLVRILRDPDDRSSNKFANRCATRSSRFTYQSKCFWISVAAAPWMCSLMAKRLAAAFLP